MKAIEKENQKHLEKMANLLLMFFILSVLIGSLLVFYFNQ